ncbi:MAG: tRNA (adenosine(37)-N6)-threonylcarbamoyltransferase complex dimerization subunit type 1 TsaB [Chloroflexi bacterium]|nr:tRNA (adenosine(37)-N6)-threonylcarbamoyltransferase complex dimerization subunit type 1 TsaB [Chloroflexota bacterium]
MATTPPSAGDRRPILTIDTSSGQGVIALYDGQHLSSRTWPADRTHTTTLLSEIHQLLDRADVQVRDLGAMGIAIGPGAFTGLRVGFGVAKGFHLATGLPLIGVPTLEAAAVAFASCGTPIVAAIGAGRGRLVWAQYTPESDGLLPIRPLRNGTFAELMEELQGMSPVHFTGEIEDDQARLIEELEGVSIPAAPLRFRHPGALAQLAWRRWRSGSIDDAESIEPVYLSR